MFHYPTNIYIIRHGESLATLDPTLFGRMDPTQVPLSQWGYEQAVDTGKKLAEHLPPAEHENLQLYYSPHKRIVQSMEGFLEGFGKHPAQNRYIDPALREREHGHFNGLDEVAQQKAYPEVFAKLHGSNTRERFYTKMPGGGESLADLQERLEGFVGYLSEVIGPGQNVAIITHGGNCRLLEHMLTHGRAVWLDMPKPPGTGDIIHIDSYRHRISPPTLLHSAKKRSPSLPADYKTTAWGEPTPSQVLR